MDAAALPSRRHRAMGPLPKRPNGDAATTSGRSARLAAKGRMQETTMFDIYVEETEWGGRVLRLETGRIARQADGAVLASLGETTVLATVVGEKSPKPGVDFFPLTVNYQ